MSALQPRNLIAELTYRCPLRCPYCSNPTDHANVRDGLDAATWCRVFTEAARLGILHVGLTGGEPSTRRDLEEIVAGASRAGLFTHLVTAGTPLDAQRLAALVEAGLRSVQLSIQDALADESDRIAGTACFETKLELAHAVRAEGLPLVLNVVLHRHNLMRVRELIALARDLGAERLELANAQYQGWASLNRDALLPSREAIDDATEIVREERERPGSNLEIQLVLPDYFRDRPKPCMGGWGRHHVVVAPDGTVLPCQAAATIPGLEFWNAAERSLEECYADAPGMNAFRGEDWMQEPCRSCDARHQDFGGCRCQAYALVGDAAATDPTCGLSPRHALIQDARHTSQSPSRFQYRGASETIPGDRRSR
jgi:pyrroloquinoline quinone biosynthesis protein E